ncbi:unnamed protein product [Didymodactylos carnosus]|uniref:Uncharacterized protein n=1 Tax=Didymodactylos carnosus TaxID=1234261 RepID=A0A813ZC83_9BILA|nr:unnamed protein product [Didymodactylos carnosus]CAF0896598.1 unnamed protein product [Didymodactylos carnosus]CAF3616995.1 unnamed protein product [Didymodactylos carnosus]CAF3679816.1 unnamed protein product [Didymodactylos carnosus]
MMLMNGIHRTIYPNIFKTIRNFFFRVLISGYFDSTFELKTFTEGAKQAVTVVSHYISQGRFDDLNGLVVKDAINEIRQNFQSLPAAHKQKIPVLFDEIIFSFPYEIGIIIEDKSGKEKHVEQHMNMDLSTLLNFSKTSHSIRDSIVICNYRFVREMTKGVSDGWTINALNHWLPNEYL